VLGSVVAGRVIGEASEGLNSREAKQEWVMALIEEHPGLTAPALARIAGVDPKTVRVWRERLAV
jgi:hypothetical protein